MNARSSLRDRVPLPAPKRRRRGSAQSKSPPFHPPTGRGFPPPPPPVLHRAAHGRVPHRDLGQLPAALPRQDWRRPWHGAPGGRGAAAARGGGGGGGGDTQRHCPHPPRTHTHLLPRPAPPPSRCPLSAAHLGSLPLIPPPGAHRAAPSSGLSPRNPKKCPPFPPTPTEPRPQLNPDPQHRTAGPPRSTGTAHRRDPKPSIPH